MLKTTPELLAELGAAIRFRRMGYAWSQEEAAQRAGMSLRTWRRMEKSGQATIENLANAAIALRCEDKLGELFPAPAARSMDALLAAQRDAATPSGRWAARGVKRVAGRVSKPMKRAKNRDGPRDEKKT
jgi:transcriptional regulator with XRE-family HTH domain